MEAFDAFWKEALDNFFAPCLALLFPDRHGDIDWSHCWENPDRKREKLFPETEVGSRHVDKPVQVWLHKGTEAWILLHPEVQASAQEGFPRRMFVYYYCLHARSDRAIVSVAILADDPSAWRHGGYGYERWGRRLAFLYRMVKRLDCRSKRCPTSHQRSGTRRNEAAEKPFCLRSKRPWPGASVRPSSICYRLSST